ncbi:MAG TPA: hypothetical protein VJJ82_00105 [Candidatus Nanoarchaeia archaeon]|nr:hypothetical protein [Candidatus Nanoarchaeia archaeon]
MKVKNIKLTIRKRNDALTAFAKKLEASRKGEQLNTYEEVSFQNIDTLRKILTERRVELLRAIKQRMPESIYELAKLVGRDLKSVNTDLKILVDLGLISLEKSREERKRTKPRVEFDRLNVEIAM